MKIIGQPDSRKKKLKDLIVNLDLDEKYLIYNKDFRKEILESIDKI